ncbi:MAG: helix-turn-helix domain-containing protein [Tannerellaceae bacterium]
MKSQIKPINYAEEHHQCVSFRPENRSAFIFKEYEKGYNLKEHSVCSNLIVFLIKGKCLISSNEFSNMVFVAGEMLAIPEYFMCEVSVLEDCKLLFMHFDAPTCNCSKLILNSYKRFIDDKAFEVAPTAIIEPLNQFIDLLDYYLSAGGSCNHLYEIKKEEFFLILRLFYTKEDLAQFFYPILKHTCTFRRFVLDNYQKVSSVSEMIDASNMSKSVFYEKFKKTFGVSAKQWLLARQKQQILNMASDPEVSAKDIMVSFNFSSLEHLNSFCKRQFGLTPKELIKKQQLVS